MTCKSFKEFAFSTTNGLTIVLLTTSLGISSASCDEIFHPYIGAGFEALKLDLSNAYGRPLFKQTIPGASLFAGLRLGKYAGIEFEYNTFSRKRESKLNEDDIVPGRGETLSQLTGNLLNWISYDTQLLIRNYHLGFTGYLPLKSIHAIFQQTEFFTTFGFSKTLVRFRLKDLANSAQPNGTPEDQISTYDFKKNKTIPFVKIGLTQNITQNIQIGLFSEWKRLDRFKIRTSNVSSRMELQLKNCISYGLKIVYNF